MKYDGNYRRVLSGTVKYHVKCLLLLLHRCHPEVDGHSLGTLCCAGAFFFFFCLLHSQLYVLGLPFLVSFFCLFVCLFLFCMCDSFSLSKHRGSHIPSLWMVHAKCVFVAGIHLSRTWMSVSFESMWWNACMHRLDLSLYSHLKEF